MKFSIILFNFIVIAVCLASNSRKLNLSSGNFGRRESTLRNRNFHQKIVGGANATADQAPWQVAIEAVDPDWGYVDTIFSGAIIDGNSVLTSGAACSRYTVNNQTLRIKYGGTNRLNLAYSTTFSQLSYHPNYSYQGSSYNLCIIRLRDPVQTSSTVQIIPIVEYSPTPGTQANLTAWGEIDDGTIPAQLQVGSFSIISKSECEESWTGLTDDMLCADSSQNSSACWDDWGGPLVVNGQLVGIVSFIDFYCEPFIPAVYSDIAYVKDWIKANINNGPVGSTPPVGSTTPSISTTNTTYTTSANASTVTPIYSTTSNPGEGDGNCGNSSIVNISIKLNIKINLANISNPIIESEISGV